MNLLTSSEVAKMLRVKSSYFLQYIAPHPKFPKGISYPNARGGMTRPLWDEKDILKYLQQNKMAA